MFVYIVYGIKTLNTAILYISNYIVIKKNNYKKKKNE